MENTELITILNRQLQTELPQHISHGEILRNLSEWINHLIKTDFQKLIFILYKTDISERKLKQLLQENGNEDAALIIVKLIIEREQQKIQSRNQFRNEKDISDEERW